LLLAGLILLTYWLWPEEISFVPVSRVLETEKITVTADPIPTASSKDASRKLWSEIESQQDTARSVPIRDNSAVAEKVPGSVTSTGDTHGDSAVELRSEVEVEQNTARSTPTWNDNAAAEKVPGSVTSTGDTLGDSAVELRSEVEVEQNTARSTPTWNDNAAAEKVTGSVTSTGKIIGDSAGEMRLEIDEEQNAAQPFPVRDHNAAAEEVPGSVAFTGEITGDSAREMRSKIDEEQNAAQSTPAIDHSAAAEEVTGSVATTGEITGDSDREVPPEIEEEQNATQSNPDWDKGPVAEKASDSVTVTSEKAEEKFGITAAGEPKTEPASESQVAQTASMKTPNTAESENRLLKIETDDFTLTIERGQSGKTQQPQQKASAPTERTGDTEPSPTGPAPVVKTEHTHIVVKGDTLWDIAAKYLGNPFRYPELAELSRIKNPHWIYPGDLIRIIIKKVPGKSNQ